MTSRSVRALAISTAAAVLAGCAVGPDFRQPDGPSVERYTLDDTPRDTAQAPVAEGKAQSLMPARDVQWRWWSMFGSAELDAIVEAALQANPDLQAAEAALRAAHESAAAQGSTLWPTVDAHFAPSRQSIASTTASPQASGASLFTVHTAQLNISYVADVFGSNRRLLESARAQEDQQRFERGAAYLTLTSNVVIAAIQEASTRAQLAQTRELIDVASRQLEMVRKQQRAGVAGAAEVAAQESLVAQMRATLPPLEKQLAQVRDQLARLSGRIPPLAQDIPLIGPDTLRLPQELPLSLPSRLVRLRPDILAAEAQLHAASAQVGVAKAARLPNITLSANVGSTAEAMAKLFKAGSGFWAVSADVAQPLFNAGALAHRQHAAEALYDQAEAQYRSTVLNAFQNVADTLEAIDADARTLTAAALSAAAAARTLDIAQRQWKAGVGSYLLVLAAQQAQAQTSIALIQAQSARLGDTAALYVALGGGWSEGTQEEP